MQRSQALAEAAGRIEGEQGAGGRLGAIGGKRFGEWHHVDQQRLAVEDDLAHGQAKALFEHRGLQFGRIEQLADGLALRVAAHQANQRGVGHQDLTCAVDRHQRVRHGLQQRIELQASLLTGQHADHLDVLHATHAAQCLAQLVEHVRVDRGRVDIDVGRHHLHGIEVQVARHQQGEHFLGDADTVDEGNVDAHLFRPWSRAAVCLLVGPKASRGAVIGSVRPRDCFPGCCARRWQPGRRARWRRSSA